MRRSVTRWSARRTSVLWFNQSCSFERGPNPETNKSFEVLCLEACRSSACKPQSPVPGEGFTPVSAGCSWPETPHPTICIGFYVVHLLIFQNSEHFVETRRTQVCSRSNRITTFFRIATPIVQNNHLFGSEAELGFFLEKQRSPF